MEMCRPIEKKVGNKERHLSSNDRYLQNESQQLGVSCSPGQKAADTTKETYFLRATSESRRASNPPHYIVPTQLLTPPQSSPDSNKSHLPVLASWSVLTVSFPG